MANEALVNRLMARGIISPRAAGLMGRLDRIPGTVEDRRADTNFGPLSGIGAALKDDAAFAAEKLGLKGRPDPLPAGKAKGELARKLGAQDVATSSRTFPYDLKPEDDVRPWYQRAADYINDPLSRILYPDSITWPDRERTR